MANFAFQLVSFQYHEPVSFTHEPRQHPVEARHEYVPLARQQAPSLHLQHILVWLIHFPVPQMHASRLSQAQPTMPQAQSLTVVCPIAWSVGLWDKPHPNESDKRSVNIIFFMVNSPAL